MGATFAAKKLKSVMASHTFSGLVDFLVMFSANVIAGNMLGETALSAISLAAPFLTFVIFVGTMAGVGAAALCSYEVGRQNGEKANGYFGQGLILSVALGLLLGLVYFLIGRFSTNLFDVSAEMNAYFIEYFTYVCLMPVVQIPGAYLYYIALNMGGERECGVNSVIYTVSIILLSIVLCRVMGVAGIGLANVISYLLSRLPLMAFLLSRRNPVRFKRYFNWRMLGRMLKTGVSGASLFLYASLMRMTLNVFLLARFGEPAIVAFTLVMMVIEMMIALYDGVGAATLPMINIYRGERLQKGRIKTVRAALKLMLGEGIAVTAVLLLFAEPIVRMFGVAEPALIEQTALSVRILCILCIPAAVVILGVDYYAFIGKPEISFTVITLYMMVFPVGLGMGLGVVFGMEGTWWGIALSGVAALAVLAAMARMKTGGRTFPLMLDGQALESELSYDVPKTKEGVMRLVDMVEDDLEKRGMDKDAVSRIMLMIEETEMLALRAGRVKREVIECGILLDGGVTVILRDSGSDTDPADEAMAEPEPEDLIPLMLIGAHGDRAYGLAGGKSRVIYRWKE